MDLERIKANSNVELFKLQELFLQTSSELFIEKFKEIAGDLRGFFNSKGLKGVPSEVIVVHLKKLYDDYCSKAFSINMNDAMATYKSNRDIIISGNNPSSEKERLLGDELETILRKCEALRPQKDVSMLGVKTGPYDAPNYSHLISLGTEEVIAQLELINGKLTNPALRDQVEMEVKDAIKARVSEAANLSIDYISKENSDSITGLNKQVMDTLNIPNLEQVPRDKNLDTSDIFAATDPTPKQTGVVEALSTEDIFTDKRFTGTQQIPTTDIFGGADLNSINPFAATDAIENVPPIESLLKDETLPLVEDVPIESLLRTDELPNTNEPFDINMFMKSSEEQSSQLELPKSFDIPENQELDKIEGRVR